ncbi:MAG TPA: hypothetical protein VNK04_24255 [Gemmataceae bacterium]|nr:hypothetical protein [Gemmataceae bacterium]
MSERAVTSDNRETLADVPAPRDDEEPSPLVGPPIPETGEAASRPDDPPAAAKPPTDGLSLEERVRRLEDAVAHWEDTQDLEERLVRRVLEHVRPASPKLGSVRQTTALMLDVGRQLLPVAVEALQARTAEAETQAAPAAVQAVPAEARAAPTEAPPAPTAERRPWLIVDLYTDLRTLGRMLRDPLYRTVWLSRGFLPLGLTAAILTSGIWLYLVPGFALLPGVVAGPVIKVVDLFLAFVLCKVLQREIRRYREAAPDPAPLRRP